MQNLRIPLVVGLLLAAAGCAQQPLKSDPTVVAQAAHYGVSPRLLQTAGNYGYVPQMRAGKAVFCRDQESTGSYIEAKQCLDAAQLQQQLGREADEQGQDQRMMEGRGAAVCSTASGC